MREKYAAVIDPDGSLGFPVDVTADLRGRKFGLLLSCGPDRPGFQQGVKLAATAMGRGLDAYLYCLDDAVAGVGDAALQELRASGLKLYACAYGAQQRGLPVDDRATYVGLTVLSDMFASTERMVSFN